MWHSLTPSDPILFDANTGLGGATHSEAVFLSKMGKVYYFKYRALKAGVEIDSGLVKVFFPPNAVLGSNWSYGGTDVLTGDALVYENTTREICVTTTAASPYSYYSEFTHAGLGYRIITQIDEDVVFVHMHN